MCVVPQISLGRDVTVTSLMELSRVVVPCVGDIRSILGTSDDGRQTGAKKG